MCNFEFAGSVKAFSFGNMESQQDTRGKCLFTALMGVILLSIFDLGVHDDVRPIVGPEEKPGPAPPQEKLYLSSGG